MVQFYDDPTEAAMLRLIGRFVYNVDMFGDTVQQIATDRVAKATREHIKQLTWRPSTRRRGAGLLR